MIGLTVEKHYELYLEKNKLDESKMHEIQKTETKRAFMGGMSQMFVTLSKLSDLDDDKEIIGHLAEIKEQLQKFWFNQGSNRNKKDL